MGATGQVGHIIAEDLLKRGHTIRVLGRNERKLRNLLGKGAEIFLYDFDDVEGLTEAFRDCFSVFCMIPPAMKEEDSSFRDLVGESTCQALKNTGVKRVVNLSSLGADLSSDTGPIVGLHRQEERLNGIESIDDLIHLRAGYFMENFSMSVTSILYENEVCSPIDENLPIFMTAARDIGWKAADFLERTDNFGKQVFDFVGPHPLSYQEATQILGQAIDNPQLKYVQISYDEERDRLLRAGANPWTADLLLEMFKAINEKKIKPTQKLTQEHHGTTTFEEFAQMFIHRLLVAGRH